MIAAPPQLKPWQQVLAVAGYPTDVVVIDYESYFSKAFGFKTHSNVEYVQDPQFEVLGVAVKQSRSGTARWYVDAGLAMQILLLEYGPNLRGCTVVAHNTKFDLLVLQHHFGINPIFHLDLKAVANHVCPMFSASLKDLCREFGMPPKGDTMNFLNCSRRPRSHRRGGRKKDKNDLIASPPMSPEQEKALGFYAINDACREFDLLERLLPKFSRPEVEIPLAQYTTDQYLNPALRVDVARAARIRDDMLEQVDLVADQTGHPRSAISGNISFRALLTAALATVGEAVPLKDNAKGEKILAIAKTDPAYELLLRHADDTVRGLMEARVALKSWPSKAKRVNNIILQAKANNLVLRVPLWYYGAHTGRWSGDEAINLQNLGSRGHPLDAEVRNTLIAPPGYSLIIADQSAVEARGTAWVAEQNDLLDAFRAGVDVYCRFATSLFGVPVRPAEKSDPAEVYAWLKQARASGKVGVLGGGYGMGPVRCQDYGRDFGLDMTLHEAGKLIKMYRGENPKIVQFWDDIAEAFHWTFKTHRDAECGPIRFYSDFDTYTGFDVVMVLPSGRELRYSNLVEKAGKYGLEITMYSFRKNRLPSKIYGGYLTENIVQGLCRDTLAEAILRIEAAGYRVPLHVHDEVVVLAKTEEADTCLARVLSELRHSPVWAPDLPLDAEGWIAPYYGK